MKQKCFTKIVCWMILAVIPCFAVSTQKHVIGSRGVGLFSNFLAVISHIQWCIKNNRVPVVYWNSYSHYYVKEGYNGSFNCWEYYFEPVSHLTYEKGDYIDYNYHAPDGDRIEWIFNTKTQPSQQMRTFVHSHIVRPFIKVKAVVQEKIDRFFEDNMQGRHVIGIHLRGTDKWSEVDQVSVSVILNEAKRCAKEGSYFFVATDDETLLNVAKVTLGERIIYCPSHYRSHDGRPIHYNRNMAKAALGEEIVIEAMLLSLCNSMVHTCSNVSTAVLFLNPDLENVLLSVN